jgi:hypothetical protein
MVDLLSILGLALVCGGWIALQRWIAGLDPEIPGVKRSCSGCQVPGATAETCAACHDLPGAPKGA